MNKPAAFILAALITHAHAQTVTFTPTTHAPAALDPGQSFRVNYSYDVTAHADFDPDLGVQFRVNKKKPGATSWTFYAVTHTGADCGAKSSGFDWLLAKPYYGEYGAFDLEVTISSGEKGGLSVGSRVYAIAQQTAAVTVRDKAAYRAELRLSPSSISLLAPERFNFEMTIHNTGSSGDSYDIALSGAGWIPHNFPYRPYVDAGQSRTFSCGLTPPLGMTEGQRSNFIITLLSVARNARVDQRDMWVSIGSSFSVENVRAHQLLGTKDVEILYDLIGASGATAKVSVSATDAGTTIPISSLSGDVGSVQSGVSRRIIWPAGIDWDEQVSDRIRFAVSAAHESSLIYVATQGQSTPIPPYSSPQTAANSIQAAVDLAKDGDEVVLLPGTYALTNQVSIIWKGVTVRSRDGRAVTVVDGQGAVRPFFLSHPLAIVQGLTIRNGRAPQASATDSYGGGVYIQDGGVVKDSIVELSTASYGGGIRIFNIGEVRDSVVRLNSATKGGGGIHMTFGGTVDNTIVHDNSTPLYGGGIYAFEGGTVSCSLIYNNTARWGGGVRLYQQGSQPPVVTRSRIRNNTAMTEATNGGGGVQIAFGGEVNNSLIYDNEARQHGGGVYLYQGGEIINCTVVHNTADVGGGVYTHTGGNILNTILFWNQSPTGANHFNSPSGAIYRYCLTSPWIPDGDNATGLPAFTDRDARDYRLTAGSPAIDAGLDMTGVDYEGNSRKLDGTGDGVSRTDIGAYEFVR